jgi:hypothetical protein
MSKEKITASKEAMINMMLYYHSALKEDGYPDPKGVIVDTVFKALRDIDSEKYLLKAPNASISPSKIINDIIVLIDHMRTSKQLNVSDLILIKQNLVALKGCVVKE